MATTSQDAERGDPDTVARAPADTDELVAAIAARLGETADEPLAQLGRAVATLGGGRIRAILAETLATEAAGGMLVESGKRRRTPGGVFFRLVQERASLAERRAIFLRAPVPPPGAAPPAPPFTWETFGAMATAQGRDAGEASTVKITVIGRPTSATPQGDAFLVVLAGAKPPSLPKGLPAPQGAPPPYAVLIARKQWNRVAEALRHPDDRLVIEGYPTLAPGFAGITVLATNVTTVGQQAAKRDAQRAQQVPE